MANRKIAECINVRIQFAQYEHIEFTKYAEEEIEFSSAEERAQKEDALREDLVASLMRDFREVPKQLGKGLAQALKVEEKIQKAIPQWLANNPIPNLANTAKKVDIKNTAKQYVEKAKAAPATDVEVFDDDNESKGTEVKTALTTPVNPPTSKESEEKELFEDGTIPVSVINQKPVDMTYVPKEATKPDSDGFELFSGEDIFGDEK